MSTPEDLKGLPTDELKDLWSANDQMQRVLKEIAPKTSDSSLKEMLGKSVEGILKHTELLKELLAGQDEKVSKEHCRGMEGRCCPEARDAIVGHPLILRDDDGVQHGNFLRTLFESDQSMTELAELTVNLKAKDA